MSEAGIAVQTPPEAKPSAPESGQSRVIELKVSGHLMTLDAGLYCVFQPPGVAPANDRSGLPGIPSHRGCVNSLACGINSKYARLGRLVCQ